MPASPMPGSFMDLTCPLLRGGALRREAVHPPKDRGGDFEQFFGNRLIERHLVQCARDSRSLTVTSTSI